MAPNIEGPSEGSSIPLNCYLTANPWSRDTYGRARQVTMVSISSI